MKDNLEFDLEAIDLVYQEIMTPELLYENFKTIEQFRSHLSKGNRINLEYALKKYEQEEMYDECILIKNFINQKFGK